MLKLLVRFPDPDSLEGNPLSLTNPNSDSVSGI